MQQLLNFIDNNKEFSLFVLIGLIIILGLWCAYYLFKTAPIIKDINDPMNEELNNVPFWIFRHPCNWKLSYPIYTEKQAISFAASHPFWTVSITKGNINTTNLDELHWDSITTVWDEKKLLEAE